MASRIVQYFADKLRTVKEYPITLTKAVYDENGKRLDNNIDEINRNLSELNNIGKVEFLGSITASGTDNAISFDASKYHIIRFELCVSGSFIMDELNVPYELINTNKNRCMSCAGGSNIIYVRLYINSTKAYIESNPQISGTSWTFTAINIYGII